jgi:zinc protease
MPFRRKRFIRIEQSEVEGVPLFWAEAPGPFVASIIFRTGRADETLPTAGITHLVEHLAFPTRQLSGVDMNGTVTGTETIFWAAGPRERALERFAEVLRGLSSLPLERLETERRILLTEAASASSHPVWNSASLRFGPRGHGIGAYEELGLYAVDQAAVEEWWRERFTAENAAIWMSGRPPSKLEMPLLRGERKPMPEVAPIGDIELPSHNTGGPSGGLSAALLAERSFSVNAALRLGENRIRQRMRYEQGLTYGAHVAYDPLSRDKAHAVVFADCLDEHAVAARDSLLGALREVAAEGPTPEELQDDFAAFQAALAEPTEAADFLYGRASDELLPGPAHTVDQLVEGRAALTREGIAEALAAALGSLILTTPEGTGDVVEGLNPYPLWSRQRVDGRGHRLRGLNLARDLRKVRLIAGREGITIITPADEALTVPFAECVAVKRWTDGTRGLWSEDGFYVEVTPTDWRNGEDVVRLIDESVPASLVVPLERELEERAASVETAALKRVKRGWMTSQELDRLPAVLDEGERVTAVAKATRGWRAGVVAVTDRRVVFLYLDSVLIDVPFAAIKTLESDDGTRWTDNSLTITTAEDRHELTDISPKEQLDDLFRTIEQARRGEG